MHLAPAPPLVGPLGLLQGGHPLALAAPDLVQSRLQGRRQSFPQLPRLGGTGGGTGHRPAGRAEQLVLGLHLPVWRGRHRVRHRALATLARDHRRPRRLRLSHQRLQFGQHLRGRRVFGGGLFRQAQPVQQHRQQHVAGALEHLPHPGRQRHRRLGQTPGQLLGGDSHRVELAEVRHGHVRLAGQQLPHTVDAGRDMPGAFEDVVALIEQQQVGVPAHDLGHQGAPRGGPQALGVAEVQPQHPVELHLAGGK